jgi:hypothetical protein
MINVYVAGLPANPSTRRVVEALDEYGFDVFMMDRELPDKPETGVRDQYVDACVVIVREQMAAELVVAGFMRATAKPVLFFDPMGKYAIPGLFKGGTTGRYFATCTLLIGLARIAMTRLASVKDKRDRKTVRQKANFDALMADVARKQMQQWMARDRPKAATEPDGVGPIDDEGAGVEMSVEAEPPKTLRWSSENPPTSNVSKKEAVAAYPEDMRGPRDHLDAYFNFANTETGRSVCAPREFDLAYGIKVLLEPRPDGRKDVTLLNLHDPSKPFEVVKLPMDQLSEIYNFCRHPMKGKPVVPKDYPDDQVFLCQQCHKEYRYGEAKADLGKGRAGHKYNPLCFCTEKCGDKYLVERGTCNPPVGAEIPLGVLTPCNLGTAPPLKAADFRANLGNAGIIDSVGEINFPHDMLEGMGMEQLPMTQSRPLSKEEVEFNCGRYLDASRVERMLREGGRYEVLGFVFTRPQGAESTVILSGGGLAGNSIFDSSDSAARHAQEDYKKQQWFTSQPPMLGDGPDVIEGEDRD